MEKRIYKAGTTIGLSVTLKDGRSTRVSFSPLSEGGSVFYTDDPELQWALEHHYRYGKLFRLEGATSEAPAVRGKKAKKASKMGTGNRTSDLKRPVSAAEPGTATALRGSETENSSFHSEHDTDHSEHHADYAAPEDEIEEPDTDYVAPEDEIENPEETMMEITVTDMDDAKDYLSEHHGIVRTKLKSEAAVKAAAAEVGIIFKIKGE